VEEDERLDSQDLAGAEVHMMNQFERQQVFTNEEDLIAH
jgi:hypothetical protein